MGKPNKPTAPKPPKAATGDAAPAKKRRDTSCKPLTDFETKGDYFTYRAARADEQAAAWRAKAEDWQTSQSPEGKKLRRAARLEEKARVLREEASAEA